MTVVVGWEKFRRGSEQWYDQHGVEYYSKQEPWRTLDTLGVVTRVHCVAWALVEPLRIGSLAYVLPKLTARLKLDYDDAGVVEILRWWCARHGGQEPAMGWVSFVVDTPMVGSPCIHMEPTEDNVSAADYGAHPVEHRFTKRSCDVLREARRCWEREHGLLQDTHESHSLFCSYLMDERTGYERTERSDGTGVLYSPLTSLIADGEFFSLSSREKNLYAYIWYESRQAVERSCDEGLQLPSFPFITAAQDEVKRVTGMSDPGDPAKTLTETGFIERKLPANRDEATQYRLVVPPPHRYHDEALKGLAERWAMGELQDASSDDAEAAVTPANVHVEMMSAIDALRDIAGDLPPAAIDKLAHAGISKDVAERHGIVYLSPEGRDQYDERLRLLGLGEPELRRCGLWAYKMRVYRSGKPSSYFVTALGDHEQEVLAFRVTDDGSAEMASTAVANLGDFGTEGIATSDEFVLCRNPAEVLAVESAGYVGVSYGFDTAKGMSAVAPTTIKNLRPWTGKYVLLSWRAADTTSAATDNEHASEMVLTGASWGHMSTPLSAMLGDPKQLHDALELDFAALRGSQGAPLESMEPNISSALRRT